MKRGGQGGNATVAGDDSIALGGDGGEAVIGDGGPGGHAAVIGTNSEARGGKGGRGGIGPGEPGGDATLVGDNAYCEGGQGGESSQLDGRGGRGGRAGGQDFMGHSINPQKKRHLRWPYGEEITEYGRGGDASDTPQYKARRIIIEELKKDFFHAKSLPLIDVWWDRDTVSLEWLNMRLKELGHRWHTILVDWEYEFRDD